MNNGLYSPVGVAVAVGFAALAGYAAGRYRFENVWRDRDGTVVYENERFQP